MTDEVVDVLKDIRRWVKVIGIQQAKPVLQDALSDEDSENEEKLRIIYHLTNGENGTRDIVKHVSPSHTTVARRQREWADMGLVERNDENSPYRQIISLEEAGMEVPEIPEPEDDNDG